MAGPGRQGLNRGSLALSLGVHIVAFAALVGLQKLQKPLPVYETIAIRLVSAPPATAVEETPEPPAPEEELVVETPEEAEPVVEEEAPVVQEEPEPEPEPQETPTPPVDDTPPPAEDPAPSQSESDEPREEGGEDLDVRLEGLKRDYPAYYGNIIVQMRRCFRPSDGSREASVRFMIHRDGSTSDFETVRSSGSFAFDVEAQGAVECAGRPGRIGPLPDDFPWDVLPIEFTFSPRGG